jgi:hypothetical protein
MSVVSPSLISGLLSAVAGAKGNFRLWRKKTFPFALLFAGAIHLGAQPAGDFIASVQKNFARWDLNRDGILSSNELDVTVADRQITNENAAAVAALKRASRQTKIVLPPLTLENITALTAQRQPDLSQMFRDGLRRIAGATNRNLFTEGLPKLETIHQGRLGNCFCLAPLGAMVHRNPAQVAEMFSAESNGNYCVRFGSKSVVVAPPTDTEIALTSSNEHEGIWVNLYEKAVGTARNEDRPPERRADLPLDVIARGGSAGTILAYITGHDIERFSFKFGKAPASATNDLSAQLDTLRKKLSEAVRQRRLMTCGTVKSTTAGLTSNHAYAVLNYDAAGDTVRLWNPHGENFQPKGVSGPENGYPTTKGVFEISLAEFVKQFNGMAFELADSKRASLATAPVLSVIKNRR